MVQECFLKGRVALVTGGGSGMGRAIAIALASAGADVAIASKISLNEDNDENGITFLPNKEQLEEVQTELEKFGSQALATDLDVCSNQSVQTFFDMVIKKFGKVDILVNAAGITAQQEIEGHTEELWNKVMDVNLNGAFRMIRLCFPGMKLQKWGRIINIASAAASVGSEGCAAYCASKSAVLGLSRCVAIEGALHGITSNTLSPGWVATGFGMTWFEKIFSETSGKSVDEQVEEIKNSIPQKRFIEPEEVGAFALFLCREEAKGVTMQDHTLSCGAIW